MKLTSEQLAAIQSCNSAQEIVDKAKESGFDISLEAAAQLLDNTDLNLDALDTVAGGSCNDGPEPDCPWCGARFKSHQRMGGDGGVVHVYECSSCTKSWSVVAQSSSFDGGALTR